jgi:hypothetical protein
MRLKNVTPVVGPPALPQFPKKKQHPGAGFAAGMLFLLITRHEKVANFLMELE